MAKTTIDIQHPGIRWASEHPLPDDTETFQHTGLALVVAPLLRERVYLLALLDKALQHIPSRDHLGHDLSGFVECPSCSFRDRIDAAFPDGEPTDG